MKHFLSRRSALVRRVVAGALLAASATAAAIDAEGNYAVWGVGQASCHQFDQAYAADEIAAFKAYLAGYLTAYNAMAKDVYTATGSNTLKDNLAALAAHCAKNPMDSYERGIQALLEASARRKSDGGGAWGRAAPAGR
ncbi:MAG TPA: hypothetical protein PJ986_08460 [Gammaproteobacteria bacterium]|nr:hypothetical protein [Gammaproteobacteria bacterium]